MTANPFTTTLPTLQRAWDATSWNALQFCPRYYWMTIVQGYRDGSNNDLQFGGYFASTVEIYKKGRLSGQTKEQATIAALRYAIEHTWDQETNSPWSGEYREAWQCTGTEPYRNPKGNRAKCPWSHKGAWFDAPCPDICGTCGSQTLVQRRWVSSFTKDRYALIKLVAAYCDAQPEHAEDGAYPITIGNQSAVEISFQWPLPFKTPDGEPYIACGHLDSIMRFGDEHFIDDNKTTTKTLNQQYWATYSPNTQVDFYDLTGSVLWPDLKIKGVIIEGAQITKANGVRTGIGIMRRSEAQREECLRDLEYWLGQAEKFARENYWPMNRRNCWICPFKEICAKEPDKRQMYLESNFERKHWNPLEER